MLTIKESKELIMSQKEWEEKIVGGHLLGANGKGNLNFYSSGLLHHMFGDEPEEIVRVKIVRID